MNYRRFIFSGFLGLAAFCAAALTARAQDTSSVNQAFQVARASVRPALQNKIVSVYGLGSPAAIQKWYIIFYDPAIASHGQAVLVENGAIVKSYEARGGMVYPSRLTFNPSRITNEQPALNAAQNYATQHNIAYDSVRVLLKPTTSDHPLRWRIELMDAGNSEGYVFINAADDAFVTYASSVPAAPADGHGTGSVKTDAENFGNDVKHTFLGIGGDLQQFFTGERTVDR